MFRLALGLGKSVTEIEQTMTSREIGEWMAYFRNHPWGEERADMRAGTIASTIANVNRDPNKGRPFTPKDFMPFERDKEKEKTEAIKAGFRRLKAMFDGR